MVFQATWLGDFGLVSMDGALANPPPPRDTKTLFLLCSGFLNFGMLLGVQDLGVSRALSRARTGPSFVVFVLLLKAVAATIFLQATEVVDPKR